MCGEIKLINKASVSAKFSKDLVQNCSYYGQNTMWAIWFSFQFGHFDIFGWHQMAITQQPVVHFVQFFVSGNDRTYS